MQAWLRRGFTCSSDFSGCRGWESAIEELTFGLLKFGFEVPDGCWYWHSFSDIKAESRQVAVAGRRRAGSLAGPDFMVGPMHVFGNVVRRFPREIQRELHEACPTESAAKEDALLQHLECRAIMDKDLSSYRPQSAFCDVHMRQCNPRPPEERQQLGQRQRCRFATASTVCAGFSSRGSSSGLAHGSSLSAHAWASERYFAHDDIVLHENHSRSRGLLQGLLGDRDYLVIEVALSPYHFGFPFAKDRIYSCALSRSTVEWFGPPPAEAQQHIIQLFGRKVAASGDIYFNASREALAKEANARRPPHTPEFTAEDVCFVCVCVCFWFFRRDKHALFLVCEDVRAGIDWKSLLAPCYQSIWDKYMGMIRGDANLASMPLHFDCHQNPSHGTLSPEIRSFTGHSDICSALRERFVCCSELLQIHGLHPDSPVGKRFAELPISVQHSTAGNGVHFAVVGFFLAWVLAFSRPVASADSAGGGGSASAASASGGADLSDPLAG